MTTLTLSPDPDYGRMRIVVVGAAGGTLVRDGTPVRGGATLTGDLVVDDYECPFGVPVTYWVDGAPGGSTDEPVDLGGNPLTAPGWNTSWTGTKWTVAWSGQGLTLTQALAGDAIAIATTVVPVTPGQRYRLAYTATGLGGDTPAGQLEVVLATDSTPDFFDPQSVSIRSGTVPLPVGATRHEWQLAIPATINPAAGVGAPAGMRVAVRVTGTPAAPPAQVRLETVELTRLGVQAGQVTGTLDATSSWLTHPTRPELSLPVTVVDDDEWEWEAPGTAHTLIGSSDTLWTHSTRSLHNGEAEVLTSWDGRQAFRRLLADGSALLLRTPPGCYLDDQWMGVQRVTRRKDRPHDPAHLHWTLAYTRVTAPAGQVTFDPSNSWDALAVSHPTWQSVLADHATWVDVLLTPHPHSAPAGGP